MAGEGSADATDTTALDALEARLARDTDGWTRSPVVRRFARDEDGQEDFEDEALVFEMHGYEFDAPAGLATVVTFTRNPEPSGLEPSTIIRSYTGKTQADAVAEFEEDAAQLARAGYFPTGQSWAQGQWGCGAFLIALLLCVLLIGILIFIYMLVVKPTGTLTVTYVRRERESAALPKEQINAQPGSGLDRLRNLEQAKAAGLITNEEYAAKRAQVIEDL